MPRFRFPFRRSDELRQDIDEELAFHVAITAEAYEREGYSHADALALARKKLGDRQALERSLFRIDYHSLMRDRMQQYARDLAADVRFATRRIRRRPLLAVTTVATLSLGISAAVTFLGAADAILLRPLPLQSPEQIVTLWRSPVDDAETRSGLASGTIVDLAEGAEGFEAISGAEPFGFTLRRDDEAVDVGAWRVSAGFFSVLRTTPAMGRLLEPRDFEAGAVASAVITHDFWQRELGGRPEVVGGYEQFDGQPLLIAGVLPASFPDLEGRSLFVPRRIVDQQRENRTSDYWSTFARLRDGTTRDAALAELKVLTQRSDARAGEAAPPRDIQLIPLSDVMLGSVRNGLGLLALGAVLLLLMAAANTSGLLVADAMGRTRELAVRASVGAGRSRITRQLLTEGLLLTVLAGVAGLVLSVFALHFFKQWAPPTIPRLTELQVDARLLGIALLVSLVVAAVVSTAPTRIASATDLHASLKGAREAGGSVRGRRVRSLLVGAQVSMAVLLLCAGGLLLRSWAQLTAADQGYTAAGVLAVEQHIWGRYRSPVPQATFARTITAQLEQRPEITAAAVASSLPLAPSVGGESAVLARPGQETELQARGTTVSPGFFATLQLHTVSGRVFTEQDDAGSEPVVVLTESAARRLFATGDPIDQTVLVTFDDADAQPRRVIGVVRDVRFGSMEQQASAGMFVPFAQAATGSMYIVARHQTSDAAGLAVLQAAIVEQLPGAAVNEHVALGALQHAASLPRRFAVLLLAAFSVLALLLTAVGLFGLLAQLVRMREHEIGVRLALGAWPAQMRRMLLRDGLGLTSAGVLIGLVTFGLGAGVLRGVLYGVPERDPITLVAVAATMLLVAAGSSWWPATQATRVDPMRVLRSD